MKLEKCNKEEKESLIECNELNNDILFRKYSISDSAILVKENELIVALINGKIMDIAESPGIYKIINKKSDLKNWKDVIIKNAENDGESIIFLNRKIIKENKFLIKEKINYKELEKRNFKEITIKGTYDFYIENPKNFFKKVIGLRNHFSKQELIEQTRKYITSSIRKNINILIKNDELLVDIFQNVNYKKNEYDEKLLEYGIGIKKFEIENIKKT